MWIQSMIEVRIMLADIFVVIKYLRFDRVLKSKVGDDDENVRWC